MTLPENFHPHSRYTLKEAPWGFMAYDLIHNTTDGPVFDLGVDLDDRHGIAFIRVSDVEEMARVLGMATRDEVQHYKNVIKALSTEIQYLPSEVESLKDGLGALVSGFLDRISDLGGPVGNVPVESTEEESEGEPDFFDGDNGSPDSESGEASGQDDKPAQRKGPDVLSGGSSDEFGFGTLTG